MAWNRTDNGKLDGYTTVFLVLIISSVMLASLVLVDAACGYAAGSISENVCAVAGRSVLSEFQPELYKRYGIFALRKSESFVEDKTEFYVRSSLEGKKGVVKVRFLSASADCSSYGFGNTSELSRQMTLISGSENNYIAGNFSSQLNQFGDTVRKLEVEEIICGCGSDEANLEAIRNRLFASRFAIDLAMIYASDKEMSEIRLVAELLLPGIAAEIAVFTIASVKAAEQANTDVDKLLSGQTVPVADIEGLSSFGSYRDYLWAFLYLCPSPSKLVRAKKLMEDNLYYVDGSDFSFDNYVYGFDIKIRLFKKTIAEAAGYKTRFKTIEESFCYR